MYKHKEDTLLIKIRDYIGIPLIFIGFIILSIIPSVLWDNYQRSSQNQIYTESRE